MVGRTQSVHATIEVMSWVTRFVGGDGSGRREYAEPVASGETVRAVLKRFSARHPEPDRALWDPPTRDLGPHIEVLVNDAVLGISHTLDSPLKPGDRISLVGAFMGG